MSMFTPQVFFKGLLEILRGLVEILRDYWGFLGIVKDSQGFLSLDLFSS